MFSRPITPIALIASAVVVLDRSSKIWAENSLTPGISKPVIGELLQFHLTYNPGAAFSIFTNATWFFTLFSTFVVGYIIFKAKMITSKVWQIGVGGILGGAIGNLIDRAINNPGFPNGHVTDFLQLPNWPVFNVADSSVCLSAIFLIILSMRGINYDGSKDV
ncbi:MAG: signal peptidase II [Actinobacteria bacterium]|nr:signal peptidase II [Actinomycetota bacterium]